VWADPREDGTAPNNWLSIFGGPAWKWEPRRQQYYLHNFLTEQPDLNFHNPDVRAAQLDNVRFWLDRGVDGLRLDAINVCFHDTLLRDHPPKPPELRTGRGFSADNPYAFQYHWHNNTQPENLGFLHELRTLMDGYADVAALGEISSEDSLATMAEYVGAARLHMGYSFELLTDDRSAAHVRTTVETLEAKMPQGWPCWALSNHDVRRAVTRCGGAAPHPILARQLVALACSLRGSVCLYQGEELGLVEADVAYEHLRDPYGIAFWPNFKGRDGCRTPMPWDSTAGNAGFSHAVPWLPIPDEHRALAVSWQETQPASTLNIFRAFMRWRREQPALRWGDIRFIRTPEPVLAFTRGVAEQTVLAIFNLSAEPVMLELPPNITLSLLEGHGLRQGCSENDRLYLPAHGTAFAKLDPPDRLAFERALEEANQGNGS
jgi:alpha-glucosidase